MSEKIIETKNCKQCGVSFSILEKDIEFYDKISPIFNGEKFQIPNPTFCPECRLKRRMSFRNEKNLYRRKCDATGKNIISIFSPDKPYKVFNHDYWWSDSWDSLDYGMDFDFEKLFFEQFEKLNFKVPKLSLGLQNSENCDFTNDTGDSKDCYMSFRCHYCDGAIHSYRPNRSSNVVDCYQVKESENLYECFECNKCQNSKYLYKCNDTHSSYFLYNCAGCSDCILCYNLTNAKYSILNKTYSKEEYQKILEEIKTDPKKFEEYKNKFFDMIENKIVFKNLDNINSENCVGNELIDCVDCYETYMMKGCSNSRYAWDNVGYSDSMDNYSGGNSQYVYETTASKKGYKGAFTMRTKECEEVYYSMFMYNCKNCFGCIGLVGKEYCILNKQYTRQEYEKLMSEIIKHMQQNNQWGEFFPSSISTFGYNETSAYDYFPISKDEAINNNFNWSDYEQAFPKVEKIIPANRLPENISDIPDDILNWAIECEITKKPFRIIASELDFYRKNNLGVPKRHPDQRHLDRVKYRNERKLYEGKCNKCMVEIKTTNSGKNEKIIYCVDCYNKENY